MDPKVEAALKKFLKSTLVRWIGTVKSGDGEIDTSLHFIATAIKDIAPGSMFGGDSLDNVEAGLEEIAHELGVLAKAFHTQRISSRAAQARRYQQFAEKFVSEIQSST
jgi:hypothetical protein